MTHGEEEAQTKEERKEKSHVPLHDTQLAHFFTVDCSRKLLNFKQHLVVRDPTAHVVTETMKYLYSKFTEIPSASSQQVPL